MKLFTINGVYTKRLQHYNVGVYMYLCGKSARNILLFVSFCFCFFFFSAGLCIDEDIPNDVHTVGATMSENGSSTKCPLKAPDSDQTFKRAEQPTQRPPLRPVVENEGTPSKMQVKYEVKFDNAKDKESVSSRGFALALDWLTKWWKKEDTPTMTHDVCLDKKEKGMSSKFRSPFSRWFWRGSDNGETNVHGEGEPNMIKSKG